VSQQCRTCAAAGSQRNRPCPARELQQLVSTTRTAAGLAAVNSQQKTRSESRRPSTFKVDDSSSLGAVFAIFEYSNEIFG
ncbi:hypothetical protein SNEBB_002633, partial [Seison nebaliae]